MAKKERIQIDEFRAFLRALRLMAEQGEEALKEGDASEVLSTNFPSGVRGVDLVYKTVEGVAGSVKAAPAWDLLEPLVEKYSPRKESGSARQIVSEASQGVKRARKGQGKR